MDIRNSILESNNEVLWWVSGAKALAEELGKIGNDHFVSAEKEYQGIHAPIGSSRREYIACEKFKKLLLHYGVLVTLVKGYYSLLTVAYAKYPRNRAVSVFQTLQNEYSQDVKFKKIIKYLKEIIEIKKPQIEYSSLSTNELFESLYSMKDESLNYITQLYHREIISIKTYNGMKNAIINNDQQAFVNCFDDLDEDDCESLMLTIEENIPILRFSHLCSQEETSEFDVKNLLANMSSKGIHVYVSKNMTNIPILYFYENYIRNVLLPIEREAIDTYWDMFLKDHPGMHTFFTKCINKLYNFLDSHGIFMKSIQDKQPLYDESELWASLQDDYLKKEAISDSESIELIEGTTGDDNNQELIQDNETHPATLEASTSECVDSPDKQIDFSRMISFKPHPDFNMSELYSFLIDEGVLIDIDEELFTNCISHAHINILWDNAGPRKKHNMLQCVFKMLRHRYRDEWIRACAESIGKEVKKITNPTTNPRINPQRSKGGGKLTEFEDKLRRILRQKKGN